MRALNDESPDSDPLRLKLLARIKPEEYNDSLISARAAKTPTVNIDQRQQAFFPRALSREEWAQLTAPKPAIEAPK